ncbi:chitosanase [Terribacillus sp. DMT04]|uniref:chitosanase n=1 Tax=Terribacillus sp. DMT04 TaxID=2850441 RepID=UPI001C2BA3E1|nr:chitosanase [Terribacillus sp. DMT04]QXE01475.1 chitosanase [Terribacillus sp. DMT04]
MKKRLILLVIPLLLIVGFISYFQYKSDIFNVNADEQTAGQTIADDYYRKIVYAFVSSAENSSIDYQNQYAYIEDIQDGRGYTTGIIGFTSGTGDLLEVIKEYQTLKPDNNILESYIEPLEAVNGTDSHEGLGESFEKDWRQVGQTADMIQAQDNIVDTMYLNPAVTYAEKDHLSLLGQYIYYDALVVHGPGEDLESFNGIRKKALQNSNAPSEAGNEAEYLKAFLKARTKIMLQEEAHEDLSRIHFQEQLIDEGNYELELPVRWEMYGDAFRLGEEDVD